MLDIATSQSCFSLMKLGLLLFLAALGGVGIANSTSAAPLELLTAKEAAQPNLPVAKKDLPAIGEMPDNKAPSPDAPKIIVDQPQQGSGVSRPFPVKIRFVTTGGARINLNSLELDVLKLIKISLVSRLKPYLSATGINVPEAQVPSGTYNVRIAVTDDRGRRTETIQTWTVL